IHRQMNSTVEDQIHADFDYQIERGVGGGQKNSANQTHDEPHLVRPHVSPEPAQKCNHPAQLKSARLLMKASFWGSRRLSARIPRSVFRLHENEKSEF